MRKYHVVRLEILRHYSEFKDVKDENRIFPVEAMLKHKQVAYVRRKMLFTIFKYLYSFQRYSEIFEFLKYAN